MSNSVSLSTLGECLREKPGVLNIPDLARMHRWLFSDDVVDLNGSVMSWVNSKHAGYIYPEAAGLWLSAYSWMCSRADGDQIEFLKFQARQVADSLVNSISLSGGVGRGQRVYLFDSFVAFTGLLRFLEEESLWGEQDASGLLAGMERLHGYMLTRLDRGVACEPPKNMADTRWSMCFGPHLVKILLGLVLYARYSGGEIPATTIERILELGEATDLSSRGSDPRYVHALCYMLEGFWVCSLAKGECPDSRIYEGLELLAEIQDESGGIPSYVHDGRGMGPCRSDATSQAVRLWLLGEPNMYASAITRGVRFLSDMQVPSGGIRYEPGSDDINTWSTLFAAQAVDWYLGEAPCVYSLL